MVARTFFTSIPAPGKLLWAWFTAFSIWDVIWGIRFWALSVFQSTVSAVGPGGSGIRGSMAAVMFRAEYLFFLSGSSFSAQPKNAFPGRELSRWRMTSFRESLLTDFPWVASYSFQASRMKRT